MLSRPNTFNVFSAGSFLLRPANFSVLSNDQERPALTILYWFIAWIAALLDPFFSRLLSLYNMIDNKNSSAASGSSEEVLAEFFDQYSLTEGKTMLWNWYKATTSGNFESLPEIEKEDLATFYERMGTLLEAIYSFKKEGDK